LDEIDGHLDPSNEELVRNYLMNKAQSGDLQVIVISLRDTFYCKADSLIGVYQDYENKVSRTLTLDLAGLKLKPATPKGPQSKKAKRSE
jgi:structural maintenance of chromosome 1